MDPALFWDRDRGELAFFDAGKSLSNGPDHQLDLLILSAPDAEGSESTKTVVPLIALKSPARFTGTVLPTVRMDGAPLDKFNLEVTYTSNDLLNKTGFLPNGSAQRQTRYLPKKPVWAGEFKDKHLDDIAPLQSASLVATATFTSCSQLFCMYVHTKPDDPLESDIELDHQFDNLPTIAAKRDFLISPLMGEADDRYYGPGFVFEPELAIERPKMRGAYQDHWMIGASIPEYARTVLADYPPPNLRAFVFRTQIADSERLRANLRSAGAGHTLFHAPFFGSAADEVVQEDWFGELDVSQSRHFRDIIEVGELVFVCAKSSSSLLRLHINKDDVVDRGRLFVRVAHDQWHTFESADDNLVGPVGAIAVDRIGSKSAWRNRIRWAEPIFTDASKPYPADCTWRAWIKDQVTNGQLVLDYHPDNEPAPPSLFVLSKWRRRLAKFDFRYPASLPMAQIILSGPNFLQSEAVIEQLRGAIDRQEATSPAGLIYRALNQQSDLAPADQDALATLIDSNVDLQASLLHHLLIDKDTHDTLIGAARRYLFSVEVAYHRSRTDQLASITDEHRKYLKLINWLNGSANLRAFVKTHLEEISAEGMPDPSRPGSEAYWDVWERDFEHVPHALPIQTSREAYDHVFELLGQTYLIGMQKAGRLIGATLPVSTIDNIGAYLERLLPDDCEKILSADLAALQSLCTDLLKDLVETPPPLKSFEDLNEARAMAAVLSIEASLSENGRLASLVGSVTSFVDFHEARLDAKKLADESFEDDLKSKILFLIAYSNVLRDQDELEKFQTEMASSRSKSRKRFFYNQVNMVRSATKEATPKARQADERLFWSLAFGLNADRELFMHALDEVSRREDTKKNGKSTKEDDAAALRASMALRNQLYLNRNVRPDRYCEHLFNGLFPPEGSRPTG